MFCSHHILCSLYILLFFFFFFFSSRRRHTRYWRDWSSDVCSSDLRISAVATRPLPSAVRTSRWETIPFSVPAIIARACDCWCGSKKSMMRLIDSRSGERRVGEGCRSRGSADHLKKKERRNRDRGKV